MYSMIYDSSEYSQHLLILFDYNRKLAIQIIHIGIILF